MVPIPYNNLVSRTNVTAAIPEQVSYDLLQGLVNQSAALTMFRQIQMATNQTRMPVLSALPTAYFVSGDTGLKQTTEAAWANKYINVEEIAAIVPIPEAVLADAIGFDIWGNVMPLLQNAIARTLDAAIFFGVNKPASWPAAIITDAATAGNTVNRGTATAAQGGLAGDLSAAFATVERDGFEVNGFVANTTYRGLLRDVRDTQGRQLLDTNGAVYGQGVTYPMRGLWPAVATTGARNVEAVLGDFTQGVLGVRQDLTFKILDQATIQDASGVIQYNLAQQDMVALRVVFRCGFQLANTITYDNGTASTRYPFAIVNSTANP
jgi:HK97 family phage major capsid protein